MRVSDEPLERFGNFSWQTTRIALRPSGLPMIQRCTPGGESFGFKLIITMRRQSRFRMRSPLTKSGSPRSSGWRERSWKSILPGAEKVIQQALALDPDVVAGHLIAAQLHLDKSDREAAKASVAKAKAINPAGLDALALSGAIAYIEDRHTDFQQEANAALKINPRFSDAYRVPADLAAANYRFDEAVVLSRKALELDPNDERDLAAFGVQLLRTGDEAEARTVLEKAFAIDKFDRTTLNLLTMLDSLDKFETITDGNLIVKLHPR